MERSRPIFSVIFILIGLISLSNAGINQTPLSSHLNIANDLLPAFAVIQDANTTSISSSNTTSVTNASSNATVTTNTTQTTHTTNSSTSTNSVSITLNPASAIAGTTVLVSGSGFAVSDTDCSLSTGGAATPSYSNTATCSISGGSMTAYFTVGNVTAGSYTITITGSPNSDSATATLTVTSLGGAASITLNPASAPAGTIVQVTGTGFSTSDTDCSLVSGGAGTVSYSNTATCLIAGGSVSASFVVGNVTSRSYTITVTGSPNGDSASATFTVTSASTVTTSSTLASTMIPDFTVASTSNLSLTQGENGTGMVSVFSVNGFNTTISLSASWVGVTPEGVNLALAPSVTPTPNGTITVPLTVTVSPNAALGTFNVQVTGTSGNLTHTLVSNIPVQVLPALGAVGNASSTSATTTSATMNSTQPTQCAVNQATNGSEIAPLAQALRMFRDQSVMKTRAGVAFLTLFNTWYYSFSPGLASYIGRHQVQRTIFRYSLYPLIGILYASYYTFQLVSPINTEIAAVTSGLIAAGMFGFIYLAIPGYLVKRILKRKIAGCTWPSATHALTCIVINAVAVGLSYYVGTELVLGITASSLILTALTLGAILGNQGLNRINSYGAQALAVFNRGLGTVSWNRALRHASEPSTRICDN